MKNRKRNRMLGFDYSNDAIYFLTICCKKRIHHFGEVIDGKMQHNVFGEIACQQIEWLEKQYPYTIVHNYVVMPNHVHILLEINRKWTAAQNAIGINGIIPPVGTGRDLSQHRDLSVPMESESLPMPSDSIKIKSIPSLMGAFKTTSSKKIHLAGNQEFLWQRSYHDHIVRNQQAFENIDNYIDQNPEKWEKDTFNTTTNPIFNENE